MAFTTGNPVFLVEYWLENKTDDPCVSEKAHYRLVGMELVQEHFKFAAKGRAGARAFMLTVQIYLAEFGNVI